MSHFAEIELKLPPLPVERTQTSRDLWSLQHAQVAAWNGWCDTEDANKPAPPSSLSDITGV